MATHVIKSIDDCQRLLEDRNLLPWPIGEGSSDGFKHYLYTRCFGRLASSQIGEHLWNYVKGVRKHVERGADFDGALFEKASKIFAKRQRREQAWQQMQVIVRELGPAADADAAWDLIAALVTQPEPPAQTLLEEEDADVLRLACNFLHSVKPLLGAIGSPRSSYVPDDNYFADEVMLADIRCFESMLKNERAMDYGDTDWPAEFLAILRVANEEQVQAVIASVRGATSTAERANQPAHSDVLH